MHAGIYPEVPDDFGHWLAGFIDGEGCFRIEHVHKISWSCMFALALRADDRPIVEEIVNRTGIGVVRLYPGRRTYSQNDKPQITWSVWNKANCAALVRLLDRHPLRAKKARDYAIWREAVLYWLTLGPRYYGGRRNGMMRHDWGPIPDLFQRLKDVRLYDSVYDPQLPPASDPLLTLWED